MINPVTVPAFFPSNARNALVSKTVSSAISPTPLDVVTAVSASRKDAETVSSPPPKNATGKT
jgi:hypothetical protein